MERCALGNLPPSLQMLTLEGTPAEQMQRRRCDPPPLRRHFNRRFRDQRVDEGSFLATSRACVLGRARTEHRRQMGRRLSYELHGSPAGIPRWPPPQLMLTLSREKRLRVELACLLQMLLFCLFAMVAGVLGWILSCAQQRCKSVHQRSKRNGVEANNSASPKETQYGRA